MARFNEAHAQSAWIQSIAASFNKPSTLSDVTITCGNQRISCHKLILTHQSKWFEKAFDGRFEESKKDIIELHDEDESVIHAMLEFCYRVEYEGPSCTTAVPAGQETIFHALVFAAGEKYFVQGLADLAADKFVTSAKTASEESLAEAVTTIYTTIPDPDKILRKAVVDIVLEKASTLLSGESATFDQLFETLPSFGGDIARGLLRGGLVKKSPGSFESEGGERYRCPNPDCDKVFKATTARIKKPYTYDCPSCPQNEYGIPYPATRSWRYTAAVWQQYRVID